MRTYLSIPSIFKSFQSRKCIKAMPFQTERNRDCLQYKVWHNPEFHTFIFRITVFLVASFAIKFDILMKTG